MGNGPGETSIFYWIWLLSLYLYLYHKIVATMTDCAYYIFLLQKLLCGGLQMTLPIEKTFSEGLIFSQEYLPLFPLLVILRRFLHSFGCNLI